MLRVNPKFEQELDARAQDLGKSVPSLYSIGDSIHSKPTYRHAASQVSTRTSDSFSHISGYVLLRGPAKNPGNEKPPGNPQIKPGNPSVASSKVSMQAQTTGCPSGLSSSRLRVRTPCALETDALGLSLSQPKKRLPSRRILGFSGSPSQVSRNGHQNSRNRDDRAYFARGTGNRCFLPELGRCEEWLVCLSKFLGQS